MSAAASADAAPGRQRRVLLAGAIVAVVVALYTPALDAPFTFDDQKNITLNPGIRLSPLEWSSWVGLDLWSPTPRPVSNASFALNYAWGGYAVQGYRWWNIAVHALTSLCVMWLSVRVLRRWRELPGQGGRASDLDEVRIAWLSFFAGLLFAVHPLQTQAVTYVVQRMTSQSTLFYVAGLLAWMRGGDAQEPLGRRLWRGLALVGWLGSLGSKEIGVTWPLVVWSWEWGFVRDGQKRFVRRSLPWLAGGAVCVGLLGWWASGVGHLVSYASQPFTLWERLWTEPRVLWSYAGLWLWPFGGRQSVVHDVVLSTGPLHPWTTWVSLLGWLAVGVSGWRSAGRLRLWSAGVWWWFVQHSVESTVLPLEPMYEHRMYLPGVGLAVVLPWLWWWGWGRRERLAAWLGVGVCAALALATWQRNAVWADPITLWSNAVAASPQRAETHTNLAFALMAAQRFDEARAELDRARALDAHDFVVQQNLGALALASGDIEGAERSYRAALEANPLDALSLAGLGAVAMEQGRPQQAIALHRRSLALRSDPRVHNNLAQVLAREGLVEEALREHARAIAVDPDFAPAYRERARVLLQLGRARQAAEGLGAALSQRPLLRREASLWLLQVEALGRAGRTDEARETAESAARVFAAARQTSVAHSFEALAQQIAVRAAASGEASP